jgi:hypothetical protein
MFPSVAPPCRSIALALASLWLFSVGAMSMALAATPLYQPGPRLGLCNPCAASTVTTVVAKIEPVRPI